jgi:peptidoglycan/LPS O-acetylase OafA/YrhL
MPSLASLTRSRGTLADLYSGRDNAIGLIRLLLATAVVLSHSKPLGLGQRDLGYYFFHRQTNVGNLAVYGFFVLSGMLITRSARRTTIGRYAWHRTLRILPGLWVCLLVTAFAVAPLVALREHGSLKGFWAGPTGPFNYVQANWWTGLRQFGIHDLFVASTPWGRITSGSVFDGALWSLSYEMCCYVGIGILAATSVLQQARRFVLFLTLGSYLAIVIDYWQAPAAAGLVANAAGTTLPLIGGVLYKWALYLAFLFLLGATLDLYRERIAISDVLGIASAVVFVTSLIMGGFYLVGFPAFGYLLIWLSVRLPRKLRWVGRRNDYSYGVYIYGFVGQQVLASLGYGRWGYLPFAAISVVVAFAAAYLSWHLVEKHALRLKGWTPPIRPRRSPETGEAQFGAPPASAPLLPASSQA